MDETLNTLPLWLTFLGPILVALAMGFPGILALRRQLKKDTADIEQKEADAAKIIQEAAVALLEPYQAKVELLTQKVDQLDTKVRKLTLERNKLQSRVKDLEKGIGILIAQLEESGITPRWTQK